MTKLEDLAKILTYSPELDEQRRWQNNLRSLCAKIRQTLRDKRLRRAYLHGLELMRDSLTRSIETGKRRLKERELRKTHYFVNPHYHSAYPFSQDAVRLKDPFLAVAKHMRRYKVKILYVTDHDNNLFFLTLKNAPPGSITKRFDVYSDDWMIVLDPKGSLIRKRGPKNRPLYIMNAREDHVVMKPGDPPRLNLEMIRPCNDSRPQRAQILPVDEFLSQGMPFATLNHPNLQDSFETEECVDRTLEVADVMNIPVILEAFNGGVTPIQGYTNVWAEQYCERNPQVLAITGSDLHRPDLRPAGVWIRKGLLKDALESRSGLRVNLAFRDAMMSRMGGDVIHSRIYSSPYQVLLGYVGKKLVG